MSHTNHNSTDQVGLGFFYLCYEVAIQPAGTIRDVVITNAIVIITLLCETFIKSKVCFSY